MPILERVLERYPPSSAAGTLEKGAVEAIVADKPPASPPLELQALVLTRTRDMAGTVAVRVNEMAVLTEVLWGLTGAE